MIPLKGSRWCEIKQDSSGEDLFGNHVFWLHIMFGVK
jgi:hypothetical protein